MDRTGGPHRGTAPRPTGTLTFLFTDIEGSTPLWDSFPDAMGPALARHDEDPDRWLVIGQDRAGDLLDLVVLVDRRGEMAIHAMAQAQVPKAARTMTTNRTVTDSEIEARADEAGYDIDHLVTRRNKRGRPTLGV